MRSKKKKFSETNEQIRERLKYQLDGTKEDEEYALKILMGFEPLDEWDYISKVLEERKGKRKIGLKFSA